MTPDSDNGRVTLAVLASKLDSVSAEIKRFSEHTERRIAFLEEKTSYRLDDVDIRCHTLTANIARLEERQKSTTGILGALTIIGSSIAAAIGSIVK